MERSQTAPAYAPTEAATPDGQLSVREVARLFNLPESRLRYWAQTGFIRPSGRGSGRSLYSFRDLIGIKVAKELLAAGLSLQRVRKNLDVLRLKLPEVDEPLARLRIRSEHDRVLVEDHQRTFDAATGQCILDFSVQGLRDEIAEVLALPSTQAAREQALGVDERSAYELFRFACEREQEWDGKDPEHPALLEARDAYERALDLDPGLAAAYTNLGSLLAAIGDIDGARDMFDEALRCDEDQPEAQSNLAALALKTGDHETAIAGYRQVLRTAPDYAEAHYGIARALLGVGGKGQALAHLERFCDAVERTPAGARDASLEERRAHARAVIRALRDELGVG
ncbi:MAG: tetratricopeptide repeat protein [Myxococcales bacterium]|nr:tetratricopeptide repeat protein [Myxococcales bacterium]